MHVSKQVKRTKLVIEGMVLELKERQRRSARIRMPRSAGSGTDDDADPISSLIIKKTKKSRRKETSRKTRTKTRKPKYLSLRLQFSTTERSPESSEMPSSTASATTSCTTSDKNSGSKQLDLFPLHPENLVEEKEAHDENMAYLFSVADGGASTLTGLLESAINTSSSDQGDNNKNNNDSSGTTTLSPSSASLTYTYARGRREDQDEVALVRTALRNKEREPSEERWVRYSEVVERRDDQEVSSCAVPDMRWRSQRLSLKLDYEEILSAWSDKGSLFIHAYPAPPPPSQSPQTVPDIHDDLLASQIPNGMISQRHGWGNDGGCTWRVPEFTISPGNDQRTGGLHLVKVKKEEEEEQDVVVGAAGGGGEDQWKMGHREASVKRYKEKRQNRLFSKRIRYQVRKINAEKRPRLKGRFVKRS